MNVIDKYKQWEVDLIRQDVQAKTFPYAICMINLEYDFNFVTLVRNSNGFGVRDVYYVSEKKKWDKRAAVGTYNYTNVNQITIDDLLNMRSTHSLVAIENNVESVPLGSFKWPKNPLIIMGSENQGIPQYILDQCHYTVEIPMFGSVRSLNVGTASGIVLNDYVTKTSLSGRGSFSPTKSFRNLIRR